MGAISGALLIVATSRYGIGMSPDSSAYVSVARNILAGQGLTMYDGLPMLSWPPLWPAFLAGAGSLGLDPAVAARWLNALIFAVIVGVGTHWLREMACARVVYWTGALAIIFSEPVFYVSTWAWSEPLFILMSLLFLRRLHFYYMHGRTRDLVLGVLLAALAIMTRYIGVSLVVAGLWLILTRRGVHPRRRMFAGLFLALVSAFPLILWMMRGRNLSGSVTGTFILGPVSPIGFFREMLSTLSGWLMPGIVPEPIRLTATLLTLLSLGWLLFWNARSLQSGARSVANAARVLRIYAASYVLCLILIASVFPIGYLDNRYLAPVYIPLVLIAAYAVEQFLRTRSVNPQRTVAGRVVAVCIALWVCYPVADAVHATARCLREGAGGYATASWRQSETIAAIRNLDLEAPVYSNAPDAIYALTGLAARATPQISRIRSLGSAPIGLPEFRASLDSAHGGTVVWFYKMDRRFQYTLDEIRTTVPLEVLQELSDGVILRLDSAGAIPGNKILPEAGIEPARPLRSKGF